MSFLRPLTLAVVLAVAAVGCTASKPAAQQSEQTPPAKKPEKKSDFKDYDEVITDEAKTDDGLFTTHRVGDKLFFEIPDSLLEREILLVSRIARTVQNLSFGGAGMKARSQQVVRWQRQGNDLLLRHVTYESVAGDSLPIYQSVVNNNFEPVVAAFDIAAFNGDSSATVIDVTDLFTTDVPLISALSNGQRRNFSVRRLDGSRSFVTSAKAFPHNVEVRHVLTYEASEPPDDAETNTISVEMNQSMVLLPADPMMPRLADARVGFFTIQQADYGSDAQALDTKRYITRWRLEPKDPEAYARGELVEPVKPIVYYVDPATPDRWRPFIKQGVEDWQIAFEAAGFKNAIIAADPPSAEEDPDWSPEDVRYSVIRYIANPIPNAQGPHVHDPRTGEILESDILWYHNVLQLLRNWYLVQTAAANPSARSLKFDDEEMGRLVRYVAAHEVGHTLGLPHNMKASAAYPVDSLRSATFTDVYGTTPSIMDYARFNYIAQPGDPVSFYPPIMGMYDEYAVEWGYRWVPGADTPQEEIPTLNALVREHEGDPRFKFGNPSQYDPTSQTESLGDDGVLASTYGIQNLQRIVPQLIAWTTTAGEDYDDLDEVYGAVISQWNRYMGHVETVIGGIEQTLKTGDQEGPVYTFIPEAEQRVAMRFFAEQAFQTPTWMLNEEILSRIEHAGAVERIRRAQAGVVNGLLDFSRMARLIEAEARLGDDTYTLGEMMGDLRSALWSELDASRPTIDIYRRNLQRAYLERMAYLMTEEMPSNMPSFLANRLTAVDVSQSDIRPFARGELELLRAEVERAAARTRDQATRYHLRDALARIDDILDGDK